MNLLFLFLLLCSWSAWGQLTHESEIATLATGGNTDTQTYLVRSKNQLINVNDTYRLSGHYAYGEADSNVNVRDWDVAAQYEKMLRPRFGVFVGEVVEGFRFRNVKARYNSDVGFKYHFLKTDIQNLFLEFGYRYTVEDRYDPLDENLYESKGRLYSEYNRKVTETFQWKSWVEYVPNFTDDKEYLLNFEVSATAILTSVFSMKVSYRGFYDDRPAHAGLETYDYQYTTALVSKF